MNACASPETLAQLTAIDTETVPNVAQISDILDRLETGIRLPFVIQEERAAEWVAGLFAEVEAEKEKQLTKLERYKAGIEARIAELNAETARLHFRFDADLEIWARGEATKRRRQSVTLGNASLCFTAHKAGFRITDEAAAREYAQANLPGLVTTETKTTTREVFHKDKYLSSPADPNGELLPGVEAFAAGETFALKLGSPTPRKKGKNAEAAEAEVTETETAG